MLHSKTSYFIIKYANIKEVILQMQPATQLSNEQNTRCHGDNLLALFYSPFWNWTYYYVPRNAINNLYSRSYR